jgi:hypothetical protein
LEEFYGGDCRQRLRPANRICSFSEQGYCRHGVAKVGELGWSTTRDDALPERALVA